MYGGGTSEEYLRKLDVEKQGFKVATKNYPSGHAKGSVKWVKDYDHSKQGIVSSMEDSLQALGTKQVDLYYLHAPDREVPFEETVQALKEEHDQGRFTRWGLSNYKAEEVDQIVELCNKHGLIKPAVYQGVYNAICRSAEPELLPTLRKHNIAFYIYNPLGGGFFAGNFKKDAEVEAGSRFDPNRGQVSMSSLSHCMHPLTLTTPFRTSRARCTEAGTGTTRTSRRSTPCGPPARRRTLP